MTIDPLVPSASAQPSPSIRELEFRQPGNGRLLITSGGNGLYYAGHFNTTDQPDVILYAGYDSNGPRLAQAEFIPYSKDFKIYVGDQKTPSKDDWDIVRSSGGSMFSDPQYRFEIRYNTPEGQRIKRRCYWQKTSDSKLGASRFSPMDFKLVDEDDDAVVAVYAERNMRASEHRGTVRLHQDQPEYARIAVLMGLLALLERYRRNMQGIKRAFPTVNGW